MAATKEEAGRTKTRRMPLQTDAAKSVSAKRGPRSKPGKQFTPEERHRMISEAAYFRAERRGFVGGDPCADWLDAEAEIDSMIQ